MKTLPRDAGENQFRTPKTTLGDLDAEAAAKVIAAAADVALIVGPDGIIKDLAFGSDEFSKGGHESWVGQRFVDTVTVESRPKIESLLRDARANAAPRWRQVNHPAPPGGDIPVVYSAVPVGSGGGVLAVGRDLRSVAVLQQRLVDAQQSMEREYSRLRHAETRYRLLFQIASEAVLIVDAASQKVVEANPAAGEMLGVTTKRVVGRPFADIFDAGGAPAVATLLSKVRAAGRADDIAVRLNEGQQEVLVSASLFRQENASHVLVRLAPVQAGGGAIIIPKAKSRLLKVVESLPDGFVVTDLDRRILTANTAFLDLTQLATEEQARGENLDRWLGRSGVDLNVLIANLREHGSVRNFATVMRGEYGTAEEVEVSAVSVANGEQPCFGFTMRTIGRRAAPEFRAERGLPQSVAQLTDLVGRVSLKELVRETTDVIERLCIEAALELTGDNRASAAEMLGLSRQSLYAKLRRYGLGDLEPESEN